MAVPRVHLFVCANRREGSPLGPGCGPRGDALYDALKREVGRRGLVASAWITKTHCLGICPKAGATVASVCGGEAIHADVEPGDAAALLDRTIARAAEAGGAERSADRATEVEGHGADGAGVSWEAVETELTAAEELQRTKVAALARRLRPNLTAEDLLNPHDFPELDDPDWHYADGILTGIQSVATALRAMRKREENR